MKLKKLQTGAPFFTFSNGIGFYALEELGDGMNRLVRLGAKSE